MIRFAHRHKIKETEDVQKCLEFDVLFEARCLGD